MEALRRETVLSDNNLSRSYTGGAGVRERFFSLEGACGRKERIERSCIPGSRQCVKLCTLVCQAVNVQERSVRGELIVKWLSTGRVQIVHWHVPTVNERSRRCSRRFFVRMTKNRDRQAGPVVSSESAENLCDVCLSRPVSVSCKCRATSCRH